jgi:hypothetical protein
MPNGTNRLVDQGPFNYPFKVTTAKLCPAHSKLACDIHDILSLTLHLTLYPVRRVACDEFGGLGHPGGCRSPPRFDSRSDRMVCPVSHSRQRTSRANNVSGFCCGTARAVAILSSCGKMAQEALLRPELLSRPIQTSRHCMAWSAQGTDDGALS